MPAASLYLRLGYTKTGCHHLDRWYGFDEHGHRHDFADPARFLVKQLGAKCRAQRYGHLND